MHQINTYQQPNACDTVCVCVFWLAAKVKAAQALWNTRDPARVAQAYTPDSVWRNRGQFLRGHGDIMAFLSRKWERETRYKCVAATLSLLILNLSRESLLYPMHSPLRQLP